MKGPNTEEAETGNRIPRNSKEKDIGYATAQRITLYIKHMLHMPTLELRNTIYKRLEKPTHAYMSLHDNATILKIVF